MTDLDVTLDGDTLRVGDRLVISFQRTLRIPDDGRDYPLPPGLGALPLVPVADCGDRLPRRLRRQGGFVVPMYQREALWIAFGGAHWKPNAVKVGLGAVNALTGSPLSDGLNDDPQDYLVCPDQPWLDGTVTGPGRVRQFVAAVLGSGHTVEEQLSTTQPVGGIRLRVYDPKPGRFPDVAPETTGLAGGPAAAAEPAMGLGAGGRIRQKIYADRYGLDTWDTTRFGEAVVHMLTSAQFREVTGRTPPPTPVDARLYTEHGLPWFSLYDEEEAVRGTDAVAGVKSVTEIAHERGDEFGPVEESFDVDPRQVKGLRSRADARPSDATDPGVTGSP